MESRQELQAAINKLHDIFRDRIAEAVRSEPGATYGQIAERYGVSRAYVNEVVRSLKVRRMVDKDTQKQQTEVPRG